MQTQPIKSLDELMSGGLLEQYNYEMDRVMRNVMDRGTNPIAAREVIITIKVLPNSNRDGGEFVTSVKSKLAPQEPVRQSVYLSQDDHGNVTAMQRTNQVPGQMDMEGAEHIPNVTTFRTKSE